MIVAVQFTNRIVLIMGRPPMPLLDALGSPLVLTTAHCEGVLLLIGRPCQRMPRPGPRVPSISLQGPSVLWELRLPGMSGVRA